MGPFKVKKSSFSYQVLSGWDRFNMPTDFCSWYRKTAMITLFFAFLIAVACFMLVSAVYSIASIIGGFFFLNPYNFVSFVLFAAGCIALIEQAGKWIARKLRNIGKQKEKVESQPSAIKVWYRSYKEKFCPMIEIVADEKAADDEKA